MPTPIPTPAPTPWQVYQAKLADYMAKAAPTPTPLPSYGTATPTPGISPGGAGSALTGGLTLGIAHQLMGGGAPATPTIISAGHVPAAGIGGVGGTAAPGLELSASTPQMMLPELGGSSTGITGSTAATTAAPSAATPGSYAAMTGGPGSLAYWAGPAAFMATAPIWAPKLAQVGEKAGTGFMKATGLKKKRFERPYSAEAAATSMLINKQLPGLSAMKGGEKSKILDALQGAKALIVPAASSPDFSKAESNTRDASRIGISSAYLTETEKNKLKSKYGKNYHFGAIKAEDLANILSPIGRNDKGIERLNAIKGAIKSAGKSKD